MQSQSSSVIFPSPFAIYSDLSSYNIFIIIFLPSPYWYLPLTILSFLHLRRKKLPRIYQLPCSGSITLGFKLTFKIPTLFTLFSSFICRFKALMKVNVNTRRCKIKHIWTNKEKKYTECVCIVTPSYSIFLILIKQ